VRSASSASSVPNCAPWSESERLAKEKDALGFYASGHPLDPYRTECELFATHSVADLNTWTAERVKVGVVVTGIKRQVSKRSGAEYARLTIEDFSGATEVLVFPEAWTVLNDRIRTDIPVLLEGGFSKRDRESGGGGEQPTFIVEAVTKMAELRATGRVAVEIDLGPRTDGAVLVPTVMADVRAVAAAHPGAAPLEARWSDGNGTRARLR
jgi:DNA polymerase-3 subunit alpha